MNQSNTGFSQFTTDQLRAALGDVGRTNKPDYLPDIVAQAARTRQRPAWTYLGRWIPMDAALAPRVRAALVLVALALLVALVTAGVVYVGSLRTHTQPPLGVFEPAAGQIVIRSSVSAGAFAGLAAIDPRAPSVPTPLSFGAIGDQPIGWSADGTTLLVQREDATTGDECCADYLVLLQAGGGETRLIDKPLYIYGATIAPDGGRAIFGAGPYRGDAALFLVEVGGAPVQIAPKGLDPTFSPDGTRVAYIVRGAATRVVIASVDGSDVHVILARELASIGGVASDLTWSPAGDRIAIGIATDTESTIYTFAPDGSGFATVATVAERPFWSPDGSQIVYTIPGDNESGAGPLGFAIADADGSNVRQFEFGVSGPWHPRIRQPVD